MEKLYGLDVSESARALPVLVLGYAVLMMHFVFSRSFRDSLLGSGLHVSSLPGLTVAGTLLAITLSLLLSFFVRTQERTTVVRTMYGINAVAELLMGLFYRGHSWIYSAYYIEVSASTALGLSLIWVLIGDWTNRCNGKSGDRIPTILICGTAAGMFAGLALVHIPGVLNFGTANFMLAGMHLLVAGALMLYREDGCRSGTHRVHEALAKGKAHLTKGIVGALAAVAVAGAATSTLLDLVFRVDIAQHYAQQAQRLHFLGIFQSLLLLGALLAQMLMNRLQHLHMGVRVLHLHPVFVGAAALICAIMPGVWTMGFFRTFEYSMRNSVFRTGTERTYLLLPDEVRVETRPLIDVVGERLGDMAAAGMLQVLLMTGTALAPRTTLLTVAGCSALLYGMCRMLEKKAVLMESPVRRARERDTEREIPLDGIAREKSVLV
ncbi:hypothetical protein [Silvibacterium sp.]|uniref:hypothetical protein n=1 Tax=Silvibacterium sp. TaxID=1964179 RepID=UPI0039E6BAAA